MNFGFPLRVALPISGPLCVILGLGTPSGGFVEHSSPCVSPKQINSRVSHDGENEECPMLIGSCTPDSNNSPTRKPQ